MLEVKDTTATKRYASYFVIHLEIDNRERSKTKFYVKSDYFTFLIINFPFLSTPASPTYGDFTFHNSYAALGLVSRTGIF